jgi:hypothetical protein
MIGESWALRAILAIPEAIRLAQTSCARSRRDGRRRETALCACVAGFIRNQESRSTGRLQARALMAERRCRRGIGPPWAGAAGDRGIDEAGRDHIAANAFLFHRHARWRATSYSAANPIRLLSNSTTGPAESTCSSSNVRHSQPMARSTWLAAFWALLLKVW